MGSRSINMQCWRCGIELKNVLLPFSRYEECSSCKVDLHVCIGCNNYDASVSDSCREDRADFILDKDKANFCDYFKVNPGAYKTTGNAEALAARARLAELFGETPSADDEPNPPDSRHTEADEALAELNRLFGDDE